LFFGNFIGTAGGFTVFPLFNWFIFPIAGIVWGHYFIRAKDKSEFFRYWPIFIIVSMIYFVWSTQFDGGFLSSTHNYYFMTTVDALFCLLYAHGNIGLCYCLSKILPDYINKIFSILSSHIDIIYIVQWCFVPLGIIFLVYLFRSMVFTDIISAIYSVIIIILSALFAVNYRKLRKRN
jgi:hypothetical protein